MKFGYSLLLVLSFLYACSKEEIAPTQATIHDYFVLNVGDISYFEEDSIIFSQDLAGTKIDSIKYLVKEFIADSFTLNGSLNFAADRYIRKSTNEDWQFHSRLFYLQNAQSIVRQEGNLPLIVLTNPLNKGLNWNATALIDENTETFVGGESIQTFKSWKSRYRSVGSNYKLNGFNEPNTISVEIANSETLIDIRKGEEIYALGKGLIYRELNVMDTQCKGNPIDCIGLAWVDKAEKGFIVKTRRL